MLKTTAAQTRGPSPWQQYSTGGDEEQNDPDTVLPYMLFEQESHELICPVCEHPVTGEVILQKRKREFEPGQSEGGRHGIQAYLHKTKPRKGLSEWPAEESSAEEGELEIHIKEQTNYELLCPDCESCITHDVILQKRKRAISASEILPQPKPWTEGRGGEIEELGDSDADDPPLKRHRRSWKAAADTDPERRMIRRVLQNQRIYDLSCPDCASHITYQVILKKKTSASGKPVGFLEKRGRRQRKSAGYVDDNPWKTRYKLLHGHSKPITSAQTAKRERRHSHGVKHGSAIADWSPAQPEWREDLQWQGSAKYATATAKRPHADEHKDSQSRRAKYGTTATAKSSPAQPGEREDTQSEPAKSATADKSLTEPLLQKQQAEDLGEVMPGMTIAGRYRELLSQTEGLVIMYFIILGFLYCVWWLLRVI